MDRALSTLAHEVPTLLFRGPESVSYGTGEESVELEELSSTSLDVSNICSEELLIYFSRPQTVVK